MDKVVVVLGNTVTALSTLRSLRPLKKEGYKIISASTSRKDNIAYHSNISDQKIIFNNGLTEGLLTLAKKNTGSRPLLLFTRDDEVVEISKNRELIEPCYRFILPENPVVETLMEKSKFTEFAVSNELTIPQTIFINNEPALKNASRVLAYPFIVKPYLMHAARIDNEDELHRLIKKLEPVHYHAMIAQKYIEGSDDQLYFCFALIDQHGKMVHKMMARKLRQWTVSDGTTSLCVTVENDDLMREVEKTIGLIDMVGFFSIEFKYDQNTGRYYIMEPTIGRFNQQVALTMASSVNFPMAMVRLLEEKKIEITPQKNGIYWIYESNDLFSYFNSDTDYGYLKNFFKPSVKVLCSANDPMPVMYEVASLGKKKINKIVRNVRLYWHNSL